MIYATQQDMLDLEGEDTVFAVFDRDRDQVLDSVAMSRALENASAEIDSALSARFELPLPQAPAWAKQRCLDIAIYLGARAGDVVTNEIRGRYEDARAFLGLVAQGKMGLGLALAQEPAEAEGGEVKGEILVASNPRAFSRCGTRGN